MLLRRSLTEFVIDGIKTTVPLHQELILNDEFINGSYDIHWLEEYLEKTTRD